MKRNLRALTDDLRTKPAPAAPPPVDPAAPAPKVRADRADKKLIAAHFNRDTARLLKVLAAEEETTVAHLLAEALEMLFRKYHRPLPASLGVQLAGGEPEA